VLRYLPTNLSAPEIARELSVSVNTVRTHIRHVCGKLGAHGRTEAVTQARASAGSIKATPELLNDPAAFKKFQDAQNQLGGALSRLLVTVERYPELKSNQNFLALQSQLEGTENRITVERMRFNEAVKDYNTRLRLFPGSIVAGIRGFKEKAFFEAAPGSEQVPKVKF